MLRQDTPADALVSRRREHVTQSIRCVECIHDRAFERLGNAAPFVQRSTDNNMEHREATGQRQIILARAYAAQWATRPRTVTTRNR